MTLDAGELVDLLRLSQRSQAWLARKLEVRAETVWHWLHGDWAIPASRHDRIRALLAPEASISLSVDDLAVLRRGEVVERDGVSVSMTEGTR
jgi:hypothetical protein